MHIKIGTRGSKLALWQAYHIQNLLQNNGASTEIEIIETKGDKILDVTLSKIGSKGVFTEELEQKLILGEIDIAVHSAKDLPSSLPDLLEIIAFTKREQTHDVVVSKNKNFILKNESSITIGSSSTRRVAFLRKYFPQIQIVDMRGNLQTRFQKLENGKCDAMLLAYAGVHRMTLEDEIVENLPIDKFIPPVGQGCIAVESSKNMDSVKKKFINSAVNHADTEKCLLAERSFLFEMNGGCSIPTFANAIIYENEIKITGGIISLDGQNIVQKTLISNNPVELGKNLAKVVLENGGLVILNKIKNT